jgi:adenylosuccinate synthase
MVLTKVDVLDEVPSLRICTGYEWRGEFWDHPMANISHLKHCEPVYEEMPGWMAPTRDCRSFDELPAACRDYIDRIAELGGADVDVVSVGPDREHTLVRRPLI